MRRISFSAITSWILLCCICAFGLGCKHNSPPRTVAPAFYHWKTELRLTAETRSYLDSVGAKKLYIKFFDVDWDMATAQPVPLTTLEMDTSQLAGLEIVPVIFITNRTLLNLPMPEIDSLTSRILKKINSIALHPIAEVQFDCDWTAQTQAKFFALLTSFKHQLANKPPLLSATIRLHQLKYPEKTGVPPVDRGMLMCYNMGELETWETKNSILDLQISQTYLPSQSQYEYALPLDIALPIFRWGVLFRDGQMIKLLNDLSEKDLRDSNRFKKIGGNRFKVLKSTYLQAHYLYSGDQIRLEAVEQKTLTEVAALLSSKLQLEPALTVAFYHLDTSNIEVFPKKKIDTVLRHF